MNAERPSSDQRISEKSETLLDYLDSRISRPKSDTALIKCSGDDK